MLVIAKTLTNVTFVGYDQQVRYQTGIKMNHTCKLIDAYNRITLTNGMNPLKTGTE